MRFRMKNRIKGRIGCFLIVLPLIFLTTGLSGCERKREPIKVGFVGGLTGRHSDLGTAGRNGVILAVEEVNEAGGIHGRPVELITKDDKQDPETAVKVDKELIQEGVVAIIGHMTSAMSVAALPLINKEKMLMISPTTSTDELSGMDDFFVRVMAPNNAETDHLARYAFEKAGLRKMAVAYDLSNRAYTERYFRQFRSRFETMGGKVIKVETFRSGPDLPFETNAKALLETDPDGLLIVASALDTAMICQHIRRLGSPLPILSGGWAMTDDLIHHGGRSVEGLVFSTLHNEQGKHPCYLKFRENFKKRFGHGPNFAAVHGHEAAQLLLQALKQNTSLAQLKATILGLTSIPGLYGDFKLDRFGDPQRERFLVTVKAGRFQSVE